MSETIQTPTEDDVMQALLTGEPPVAVEQSPAADAQEQPETSASEESEQSPEQGQHDDAPEDAPEAGTEPDKSKTEQKPQTREQKEVARQQNAWLKINAEKEALKKEREQLESLRQQAENERGEAARRQLNSSEPLRDERGFCAEDYEKAADKWQEQGDVDATVIKNARAAALGLRHKEQAALHAAQQMAINHVIKQNPDLQNMASPLAMETRKIMFDEAPKMKFNPYAHPDGFAMAVEHAKLRVRAGSVPALEKKINELTAENQRLTKLTTPTRGGTPRATGSASDPNRIPTEAEVEAALRQDDVARVA